MSKESATEFLLMVASDTALQEKLAVATDPDSFVKIAQESGCSFTTQELFAVISEQNNEELKDEALDAVVGGGQLDALKDKAKGFEKAFCFGNLCMWVQKSVNDYNDLGFKSKKFDS
jgi:predicted ribosomally synthesized peptide with nif11-like leader